MILGSPTYISTHSASNAASIAITSNIDSTYDTYMLVMTDMHPESATQSFAFNTDHAGTSYNNPHCSTNISWQYNDDDSGTSFDQTAGLNWNNHTTPVEMTRRIGNGSYSSMNCIFYIFDPSTATTETQYMWHLSSYTDGDDGTFGIWNNAKENGAGTISKIRIVANGGGNITGTINMYGVS
jgi:hypothetical protein|tara:strand:+ start:184 stop:729 length:546 start_codon:yes stop_codon:yes gene_type:complete